MKRSAAPTMKDVVRESGVSLGTVSKVINGIPVGESYRLRVEAAIRKLGYQVNNYARSLKTNRTNCVALVMPSLKHPFFAHLTDELTACLTRRGYRSLLMITNYDPEAERDCFVMVRQNKADGVIALTYCPDLQPGDGIPTVTIDRPFGGDIPCVSCDNLAGGRLAAEKLLELGCRRLLFLRLGPDVPGEPDLRGEGFLQVCRDRRADCESCLLRDSEAEALFRFLDERIRDGVPAFDGIFCNTDSQACLVRDHLLSRGIDVPGQVQIIGFDGIPDYITGAPVCSTVAQPLAAMAETAVGILLGERESEGPSVRLPVRYLPGGTTNDR